MLGLPTKFYKTIFDIDFKELKKQGYDTLFFDLDNTIISYHVYVIEGIEYDFLKKLKEDFNIYIISNNNKKRVKKAISDLNIKYLHHAFKPMKCKVLRFVKKNNIDTSKAIWIGDQVRTDVRLANKLKITNFLVLPVDMKTDNLWTKSSRFFAQRTIDKIKKKDYKLYEERLLEYDEYQKM